MAKVIEFEHKGKKYKLEYTRESVERMEQNGFRGEDMTAMPLTTLPTFFAGAFMAHHPKVTKAEAEEILKSMTNKKDLIPVLIEMYNEPLNALMDEPPANSKGNLSWAKNW